MNGNVLQTTKIDGPHTSENIGIYLESVKSTWGLPEIIAVTDNASVEVKTFRDLGWVRIGCIGHTLNLVVRDALKGKSVSRLVAKGRNLVSSFHRSPLATGFLDEKQRTR